MENEHLNARSLSQAQAQLLDQVSAWLRSRWDQENRYGFIFNGLMPNSRATFGAGGTGATKSTLLLQ